LFAILHRQSLTCQMFICSRLKLVPISFHMHVNLAQLYHTIVIIYSSFWHYRSPVADVNCRKFGQVLQRLSLATWSQKQFVRADSAYDRHSPFSRITQLIPMNWAVQSPLHDDITLMLSMQIMCCPILVCSMLKNRSHLLIEQKTRMKMKQGFQWRLQIWPMTHTKRSNLLLVLLLLLSVCVCESVYGV